MRIVSSSLGSLVTALAVTPLDVVKVRQQALTAEPTPKTLATRTMSQCSKCGTFVLNNGLMEHIINKYAWETATNQTNSNVALNHSSITAARQKPLTARYQPAATTTSFYRNPFATIVLGARPRTSSSTRW